MPGKIKGVRPAGRDQVLLVKPTAATTAGVDVIEACGHEEAGGMDLASLPVRVIGKHVGVDLRQETEHGRGDRSRAAIATRPTVPAVNSELRSDGHRPTPLDLNPPLSDGSEDFARARWVIGKRGRDKLPERARERLSRR
jgi:hypothetical protein